MWSNHRNVQCPNFRELTTSSDVQPLSRRGLSDTPRPRPVCTTYPPPGYWTPLVRGPPRESKAQNLALEGPLGPNVLGLAGLLWPEVELSHIKNDDNPGAGTDQSWGWRMGMLNQGLVAGARRGVPITVSFSGVHVKILNAQTF